MIYQTKEVIRLAALYETILNDLKEAILSKKLPPGSKLPTEMQLSTDYQVSRITSKRALTELENLGLIERTRGRGSFVKAQAPKANQTKRILFLLPFYNDLSLGNFTEGLLPILQDAQYDLLMTDFTYLTSHDCTSIQTEFSGMIYYATKEQDHLELLIELSLAEFPVVILDKERADLDFPTVIANNLIGGFEATTLLLAQQHQRIGYLTNSQPLPQSTMQRYLGYRKAVKDSFFLSLEELPTLENFLALQQEKQITAWVCENDLIAIEAMRQLKAAKISVPDDISIIGFDNIQAAALVDPALTTISQNFDKIGYTAGQLLLEWITTGQKPSSQKIDVTLITRHSTKEISHD